MFRIPPKARLPLRILAISLSAGLFVYLVWRAGPSKLWENVVTLGWGFTWVIVLAGISHLAKTWAWRLTLGDDKHKISFSRLLGLRLGAEAAGQLGIVGQTFGDSVRVSRLGSEIPIASGLASVSLDRGLYFVTGTLTIVVGILAAMPLMSHSHALRLYAGLFALALIGFLVLTILAVRKRWPVLSGSARVIGRVSSLKNWVDKRYLLIQSVEKTLLDFHHKTPNAFWASFFLNLASHCMAVAEVCLILLLMGVKIGFFGALVVEALTKLVNAIGNVNPGNIGTFEGGNMLIGKMFGLSGATGLALGLSRRLRAFFWSAVGATWLFLLTRNRDDAENRKSAPGTVASDPRRSADPLGGTLPIGDVAFAIFVPKAEPDGSVFNSALSRVGSLPILLRTILAARKLGASRILVVVDPVTRRSVQRGLFFTGRLPESVRWIEAEAGASLSQRLLLATTQARSKRLVLVEGGTTYHPSLLKRASEWDDEGPALALKSGERLVGIYALSMGMIRDFAERCPMLAGTLEELYASLAEMHSVVCMPVTENLWQRVSTSEERSFAEEKLDRWLVKPTDGIYARMNRRISVPISRQLIKFPITANMVTMFTLGVGFASATFFACGGYWNTLLGAFLCLCASILDGCDGEVARLKLLESDFGCWLETICDYLFYLLLFAGMTIGLWRSSGSRTYLAWGGLLVSGAIATFLAIGWERQRLAAGRPEQLLKIWQTHAENRPANPFLFFSRHTEFIVRRCFFPYALLFFALFNIMNVAFVISAIAANLIWPIALYSSLTFGGARNSTVASPAASA